jgi:hypothetical protein
MGHTSDKATTGPDQLASLLGWIATGAGVAGLLAALGYATEASRLEFLGIHTHRLSFPEYVERAGAFLLDTLASIVMVLGSALNQPTAIDVSIALAIAAVSAVVLRIRRRGRPRSLMNPSPRLTLLALVALSAFRIAYWDFPVSSYRSVLLASVDCASLPVPPGALTSRTNQIWGNVVCSRGSPTITPPQNCRCSDPSDHSLFLRRTFVSNLVVVSVIVAGSIWLLRRGWTLSYAIVTLVVVMDVISVASVPLTYGRLIASTAYPVGKVVVTTTEGDEKGDPKSDADAAANRALSDPASPARDGFVLSQSDGQVVFFESGADKSVVWLPGASVREIRIHSREDVIAARMGSK